MEKTTNKIYENAINSIQDGVWDLSCRYPRYSSSVRNIYSGILLLYKYYISKYDLSLIYTYKKLKFLGDSKYKLEVNNFNKTIDYNEIKDTFEVIGKENYFKRKISEEEFTVIDSHEKNYIKIIVKHLGKISNYIEKEQKEEILLKLQKILKSLDDDGINSIIHLLKGDYNIQKKIIEIFFKNRIIKNDSEKNNLKKYLDLIKSTKDIEWHLDEIRKIRNNIEHYYHEVEEKSLSLIYFSKLIIWDFMLNYLNKNPDNEFHSEILEYFHENEFLRKKEIEKRSVKIINYFDKKYSFKIKIDDSLSLSCPYCYNYIKFLDSEEKFLCEVCDIEFSYEEYISEKNKYNENTDFSYMDSVDIEWESLFWCPRCDNNISYFDFEHLYCECNKSRSMRDLILELPYLVECEKCGRITPGNLYITQLICDRCLDKIKVDDNQIDVE